MDKLFLSVRILLCLGLLGLCVPTFAIDIGPGDLCKRIATSESELTAGGMSAEDAAKEIQAQVVVSDLVEAAYRHLVDHPTGKSLAREMLWDTAIDQVRGKLGHAPSPPMDRALQRLKDRGASLLVNADRGQRQLRDLSKYLIDPAQALKGPRTTPEEDYTLATLALARLRRGDPANASHVMDLILASQDPEVRSAFAAAGISPLELARDVLLHDLGKQYDSPHLASYRAFLETVFGPNDYLSTRILPHELGSMIVLAELAREAGIDESKIPRLQALIANHNAGYDPALKGKHFWIGAWGRFARDMRAAGVPLPEVYGAVLDKAQGGDKLTIALTSLDRGVSLSLASQEKFSAVLLNNGGWNAEGLAELIHGNLSNVPLEIESVVSHLNSFVGKEKTDNVLRALDNYFGKEANASGAVAKKIQEMATRAPAPVNIDGSSIAYQTGETDKKTWYRVSENGKAYRWDGEKWNMYIDGTKRQAPEILFRRVIFPDVGYTVPLLEKPDALREFRR